MRGFERFKTLLCIGVLTGLAAPAVAAVSFTPLVSFYGGPPGTGGANGNWPENSLIQGQDGNFYGTTRFGGTNGGYGTVFKMTPDGALTTLHSFNGADGYWPFGPLTQTADGSLYGITRQGGLSGGWGGTIFKMNTNGSFTTLFLFPDSIAGPVCLFLSSDGNFYGSTDGGFLPIGGSVFAMTPSGSITVLTTFSGPGPGRIYSLIETGDGYLYGTTAVGGTSCGCSMGSVFRMPRSPSSPTLLTVFNNSGGTNGTYPESILLAADGNFYGRATYGGSGSGTIFKMAPNGALSLVHALSGSDGGPPTGLVQATDGNFYGTTAMGGTNGNGGTIFRLSPSGNFAVLHSFSSTDVCGNTPNGGLIQGKDGSFYGTTSQGGTNGGGVVFKMTVASADAPWIQSVTKSDSTATLKWLALKGRDYQVQFCSNPSGNWSNVGPSIIATSQIATASDQTASGVQRFYRVALLP